jgi:phosphatidylglycerophosphate synthase
MISSKLRTQTNKITNALGKIIAKTGVSASTITITSILFALITFLLLVNQKFLEAGIMVLLTGLMDALDGAIARVTNTASKFGSYLDAIVDRYVEGIILLGIGISTNYWFLIFLALFGGFATSYAKARASMEAKISNTGWPELFERGERILVIAIGLILYGLWKNPFFGATIIYWALIILAIFSNISAIQRFNRAKKIIIFQSKEKI